MKTAQLVDIIDGVLDVLEKNKAAATLDVLTSIGQTLGRLEGSKDLRDVLAGALGWSEPALVEALAAARRWLDLEWSVTQGGLGDRITKILNDVKGNRILLGIAARSLD